MLYDNCLAIARIAAASGAKILQDYRGKFTVREKGPRDLVTEADSASQNAIKQILLGHFPNHEFIGEEDGFDQIASNESDTPTWVVDPLDGTVNYIHGLQGYAVSIALAHRGDIQMGVILDPVSGETFWAVRNQGAFLNDQPIACSDTTDLNSALLACSFSTSADQSSIEFLRFARVLGKAQAIRRLGSAALNMCYVAAGRLDGYWATSLKTWDVAAGLVIAEEAGAQISEVNGGEFDIWSPRFALCGTKPLQHELIAAFDKE